MSRPKRPSEYLVPDTHNDMTRKASHITRVLERALTGARLRGESVTIAEAHGYPHVKALQENLAGYRRLQPNLDVTFDIPHTPKPKKQADDGPHRCECGNEYATRKGMITHRTRSDVHAQERAVS